MVLVLQAEQAEEVELHKLDPTLSETTVEMVVKVILQISQE